MKQVQPKPATRGATATPINVKSTAELPLRFEGNAADGLVQQRDNDDLDHLVSPYFLRLPLPISCIGIFITYADITLMSNISDDRYWCHIQQESIRAAIQNQEETIIFTSISSVLLCRLYLRTSALVLHWLFINLSLLLCRLSKLPTALLSLFMYVI